MNLPNLLLFVALTPLAWAEVQAECSTIINCKTTFTVTTTLIPPPPTTSGGVTSTTTVIQPPSTVTLITTATGETVTVTETMTCSCPSCPQPTPGETVTVTEAMTCSCPSCPQPTPATVTTTYISSECASPTSSTTTNVPPTSKPTEPTATCTKVLQDWQSFQLRWTDKFPQPGPPEPLLIETSYDVPSIFWITDDEMLGEQFTISIDFVPQGKTSPPDPALVGTAVCGKDVQDCIKRGWSNGRFIVPEGYHSITVEWENPITSFGYGAGQYRFETSGSC
ncbi:hypothetical protein BDW71DRAFT_171542 [Aspergillus fruticulosus]